MTGQVIDHIRMAGSNAVNFENKVPPEVTSALIRSGPGTDSLLAAEISWEKVCLGLLEAEYRFRGLVLGVQEASWLGESSRRMAAEASRISGWMHNAADEAERACNQAGAAARAYCSARDSTVSLEKIRANRSARKELAIQNIYSLGAYTSEIAELDHRYHKMWSQNTYAMEVYESSVGDAVARLRPFDDPSGSVEVVSPVDLNVVDRHSVSADPTALLQAAGKLKQILGDLKFINATADPVITGVRAPAADEVSQSIASKLNAQGMQYRSVNAKANEISQQFVANLVVSASKYKVTEDANRLIILDQK
ncbi:PPE domain-containing protein [Mycobacterium haemophilum]|uniref:PPE domain-containing protein n=1 Tax=Mycobacterium haemophilum TaxID=29311 RepID=UPI0021F2DAC5|nr:PPE domain-containing protein [Mycobacterium haemophilum]MCV7342762.1 PPE domain-containing protein [Mycobacterium haemophilum DSM 44634]